MAPIKGVDYKLNLDGLPQLGLAQSRSANASQANSPGETPAGSGLRFPLSNGLAGVAAQSGIGRTGAGSPSKEYGSRLFPKRYASNVYDTTGYS
jgi:protein JSN1